MKISKWVEMSEEVEIEIGADDIRVALGEAFGVATRFGLGSDDGPSRSDVMRALNSMAQFLNALTDQQIAAFTDQQRRTVFSFLSKAAKRFEPSQAKPPDGGAQANKE